MMKKPVVVLLIAISLAFGWHWHELYYPRSVHAQTQVLNQPDCVLPFYFSTTAINGATSLASPPATSLIFDNRVNACTVWTLTYQVTGLSAVSIEFDGAPDSNGAHGSFTTWTNLYSGSLPLTTTTYTQISGYSYAPWVEVVVNSVTGSGQITGTLVGWRNSQGNATDGGVRIAAGSKTEVVDSLGNILPTLASGPVTPSNADGVVVSYEGLTSGGITVAMTATTSTQVIAPTSGQYIYLSSCTVSNASTTVSTDMILQDGSGGTTIWNFPAPAAATATTGGGGSTHSFGDHPLKVPTQGNGLYAANVTTGSSTKIFCNGFKSTVSY